MNSAAVEGGRGSPSSIGTELVELAAALIHDGSFAESPEVVPLIEAFATKHASSATLGAAWDTRSPDMPIGEWLRIQAEDPAFKRPATDLALTALFGSVFVDEKPFDA